MSVAPLPWDGHASSLQRLGMQSEVFQTALGVSNSERRACVPRHAAKSAPGYYAYNGLLTSLSNQMTARGDWERQDPMSMPLLINRSRKIVLTVSSGDAYTGLIGQGTLPRSRNPKGDLTRELTRLNRISNERDGLFPAPQKPIHQLLSELNEFSFWLTLVFFDRLKLEIRSEVSQPKMIATSGRVKDYYSRIPLPSYSLTDDDFIGDDDDPNDGFDPVNFDMPRR